MALRRIKRQKTGGASAQSSRQQILASAAASTFIAAAAAMGANDVYTVSPVASSAESQATYSQTVPSGHSAPDSTDIGNVLRLTTSTATTLTLDQPVTLGGIRNDTTAAFVINGPNTLTLDATGLTLSSTTGNPFGNTGVAFLAQTGGTGTLTIGANINLANTNLEVGTTSNSGVIINGTITASTAQTIYMRSTASGGISFANTIGASGSALAFVNAATGTSSLTISGGLGASVTSLTQASATSNMTLSGSLANYGGTIVLSAGQMTISGVGPSSGIALTMSAGATLTLDNSTNVSNDRITGDIVLGLGGGFTLTGNGSSSNVTEAVGTIKVSAGTSILTIGGTGTGKLQTLTATDFSRAGNGTALVRGTSLGAGTLNATRLVIGGTTGTGLTLIGTNISSQGAGQTCTRAQSVSHRNRSSVRSVVGGAR